MFTYEMSGCVALSSAFPWRFQVIELLNNLVESLSNELVPGYPGIELMIETCMDVKQITDVGMRTYPATLLHIGMTSSAFDGPWSAMRSLHQHGNARSLINEHILLTCAFAHSCRQIRLQAAPSLHPSALWLPFPVVHLIENRLISYWYNQQGNDRTIMPVLETPLYVLDRRLL